MELETFIEALYEAGWKAPMDAQHENIEKLWEKIMEDRFQDDFDTQIDDLRLMILKRISEFWENPNLSHERKMDFERILNDQSNTLEIARRIHNHYVLTGEVRMPD